MCSPTDRSFGGQASFMENSQKGYVVTIITFFVLIIMLSVALSMSSLISYRQKIATNLVRSTQSYYTAEAGIEDALLRLKDSPQMLPLSYSFNIGQTTVNVTIPNIIAGLRNIVSEGNYSGRIRKIETVYGTNSQKISFNYAAQVGRGGLIMRNGSRIRGNVFSNGNISGGSGTVDNDVIVAGNGHSIKDVHVMGEVLSYSCLSPARVDGNLTYVREGTNTCTVGGTTSIQSEEIPSQPLPISQSQIDNWKDEAAQGGVITGNYTIGNNETVSLGAVKITGDLNFGSGSILNIKGTIYVKGNIYFGNSDVIKLDSSYGTLGGVILLDGVIDTGNNTTLGGSGQTGSYLLILSTNTSGSAITVRNNASGTVFYTNSGGIKVNNNVTVTELTGYKVILNNNAVLQYDSGLANSLFSSGPGGSWKVIKWEEK